MKKEITPLQERDSCFALVLLILIVWLFWRKDWVVYTAMGVLVLGMIWPAAMRPFAWIWFAFSAAMGAVMSRVLLCIVWLGMVIPVGSARKMMGKDSMRLKKWRQGQDSAFLKRDHKYTSSDLKTPY